MRIYLCYNDWYIVRKGECRYISTVCGNIIMTFYYEILFFCFGLIIGSFLNVCIYRIPKNETVVTTPSHCTSCGHRLAWFDLIPLISFTLLKGKCRYCGEKINPRYPIVELLNACVWTVTCAMFGMNTYSIIYCLLFSALIVLSFIDINEGIVPDKINLFILILGMVMMLLDKQNWLGHIIGFFAVSLPLLVIAAATGGFGGGDIKLFAAVGLLVGWKLALLSMIAAILSASIFSIVLVCAKKAGRKTKIPLVPFISIGIFISVFFGYQLIGWYITTFFY